MHMNIASALLKIIKARSLDSLIVIEESLSKQASVFSIIFYSISRPMPQSLASLEMKNLLLKTSCVYFWCTICRWPPNGLLVSLTSLKRHWGKLDVTYPRSPTSKGFLLFNFYHPSPLNPRLFRPSLHPFSRSFSHSPASSPLVIWTLCLPNSNCKMPTRA